MKPLTQLAGPFPRLSLSRAAATVSRTRAQPYQSIGKFAPVRSLTVPAPQLTKSVQRPLPTHSLRPPRDSRKYSSGSTMSDLTSHINPTLFKDIRSFWYEHIDSNESLIFPSKPQLMRWFMGNAEMDKQCVDRYLHVLEAIKASGITTGADLLRQVPVHDPLDWLSLVLLLDQMPRNCYRGPDSSSTVFQYFDPIARDVAAVATEQHGLPESDPAIRWQFAYRLWFTTPLMHAEDLAAQDLAMGMCKRLQADIESLLEEGEGTSAGGNESDAEGAYRQRALEAARKDPEAARQVGEAQVSSEVKHYDIIKRFGRYPHRNKALGREMTAEEKEFLESGGDTFGG